MRAESSKSSTQLREELYKSFEELRKGVGALLEQMASAQARKLDEVVAQVGTLAKDTEQRLEKLQTAVEARLLEIRTDSISSTVQVRQDLASGQKAATDALAVGMAQFGETVRQKLEALATAQAEQTAALNQQQQSLRTTVEGRLDVLRTENEAKLEQIRVTVDEKLQSTLEQRLGTSFKLVSEQLENVYKSVGEMQALATGVGDLKRVLTNVKTRGTWGEVSLGNLLEQVLTTEQYAKNVVVKPGAAERVEFAVKLPGSTEEQGAVMLPIDAKFPTEAYERLVLASEAADIGQVELAGKEIETSILAAAKDIRDKYIQPPYTTDFAVMYLPTEGLFAEVIRRIGLVDRLQRDFRVVVAGPTTLAALLNSLSMGFRTLAIQKRSSEVWEVLGAVKKEFDKYGEVMKMVKKKLAEASNHIDKVDVRKRAIDRTLRQIQSLPQSDASKILNLPSDFQAEVEDEGEEESN